MAETITDTQTRLTEFISETFPSADVTPGSVLNELVIKLAATIQNPVTNDIIALGQANSIASALNSTVDTEDPIIDQIASNYNLVRNQGLDSTGVIKIVVTSSTSYYLKSGFVFIQPVLSLNYITTSEYRVLTNPDPTDPTELQLISSNNLFYFLVPVIAAEAGPQYQVTDQTSFTLSDSTSIKNFVSAQAYGNFTTGLSEETDKELIARLHTGLSNKTLLSSASIQARLTADYPTFQGISLITANDAEMVRAKQNIFGISTLGMVDVYLRTSVGVETEVVTVLATLGDDSLWHFDLDYTNAPAMYRIISIVPSGQLLGGTLMFASTFDFSTANFPIVNTVNDVYEARFSKYQICHTAVTYQSVAGASQVSFDVLISYQPYIGEIQDLFLSNSERIACADYLVKAALPCYVSIDLKLRRLNNSTTLPVSSIQQDIYNYVNSLAFGDDLHASEIISICHKYPIKYVDLPIILTGSIYGNDSSVVNIASNDSLVIPSNISVGISKKTTIFITDYFQATSNANSMSDAISIEVL